VCVCVCVCVDASCKTFLALCVHIECVRNVSCFATHVCQKKRREKWNKIVCIINLSLYCFAQCMNKSVIIFHIYMVLFLHETSTQTDNIIFSIMLF
jgi:hypothetical protein